MSSPTGVHEFTVDGKIYRGDILKFENVEGVVEFAYSYLVDRMPMYGSFIGEEKEGTVLGAWKEPPHAQGKAEFRVTDSDGRRVLVGRRTIGDTSGRWTVDLAAECR